MLQPRLLETLAFPLHVADTRLWHLLTSPQTTQREREGGTGARRTLEGLALRCHWKFATPESAPWSTVSEYVGGWILAAHAIAASPDVRRSSSKAERVSSHSPDVS